MAINKILWIEEEADDNLVEFKTFLSFDYELEIVYSSSEAEKILTTRIYDLIILDIRILSGFDPKWMAVHEKNEKRLGLLLLKQIIAGNDALLHRTMIFTNENYSDLEKELTACGIPQSRFLCKRDIEIPEDLELFIKKLSL